MRKIDWDKAYGPQPEAFHATLVHALQQEEKPMKRKSFSTILIIGLLLVALAATAVAVGLNRSAQYEAIKTARDAVCEQYGLTLETLGLFQDEAEQNEDGTWTITFRPIYFTQYPVGVYTVFLSGEDAPEVTWTYDHLDLEDIAAQGLEAQAWGQAQLQRALELDRESKKPSDLELPAGEIATLEERAAADLNAAEVVAKGLVPTVMSITPREEDIPEAEAAEMAREALKAKYGVTDATIDQYLYSASMYKYAGNDEARYVFEWLEPAEEEMGFYGMFVVEMWSISGEITACVWAGEPEERTLPDGPLDDYREAVEEFIDEGAFAARTPEEKAEIAERINAAGYGWMLNGVQYGAAGEGDITEAEALAAAEAEMLENQGFTEAMLDIFTPSVAFLVEDDAPVWAVTYAFLDPKWEYPIGAKDKIGDYRVLVDPKTGEAGEVEWSLDGVPHLDEYGKDNWAAAPVWEARSLPWMLDLMEAKAAIDARYTGDIWYNLEDYAEHDQLFRDAGFPRDQYRMGVPEKGELSEQEALDIAQEALREEYSLSQAELDELAHQTFFDVTDAENPFWIVRRYNFEEGRQDYYELHIAAKDGKIVHIEYTASGNG